MSKNYMDMNKSCTNYIGYIGRDSSKDRCLRACTVVPARKNGSVELLRFLFTTIIILFHINLDLWDQKKVVTVISGIPVTFFEHGNIGVEFFFLVTGWLMAKTIWKRCEADALLPKKKQGAWLLEETLQFVLHKARAIMPYYLTACLLTPLVRIVTDKAVTTDYFIPRIPSLFLLQRVGLGKPFIGCTWYLSSMMIAMTLAYPLCRRFYRAYTHFAAPVIGMALLGAILLLTGSLGDIEDWFFITYKTNVRAFAEISIGASSYELSRWMNGKVYRTWHRVLLSVTAIVCLAASAAYMCSALDARYALAVFVLLFVSVTILFSGEGILAKAGYFDRPVFYWLGTVSLPMYVSQTLFRKAVPWYYAETDQWTQCFMIYAGILCFSILLHAVISQGQRQLRVVRSSRPGTVES
ncbi:MAG: acyltransferase family protein [Eubacteriales bacterium]|nr:acyltransferase family protein [Eubacteriales bacterium]